MAGYLETGRWFPIPGITGTQEEETDMAIQRPNTERIREAIHNRDEFRIASMSGEPKRAGNRIALNRLPKEYAESVTAASYVVYSYATAIAWWSEDDGWTVPDVYHSNTTSNHQGIARVGISHGRLGR